MKPTALPRYCHASSSRLVAVPVQKSILAVRHMSLIPPRAQEPVPFFTPPFKPPMGYTPKGYPVSFGIPNGKGKGREPGMPQDEEEVDDREWEIRSGEWTCLKPRNAPRMNRVVQRRKAHTPRASDAAPSQYPPSLFRSRPVGRDAIPAGNLQPACHVQDLSPHPPQGEDLPPPSPIPPRVRRPRPLRPAYVDIRRDVDPQISSLGGYSMAFAIARNGMQGELSSDCQTADHIACGLASSVMS